MFARKLSSEGRSRCPRPGRARKATGRPSSRPRIYASEGSPKGVGTRSSRRWVRPSISYRPLPPMMTITGSPTSFPSRRGQRTPRRGAHERPRARPCKQDAEIIVAHPVKEAALSIPLVKRHDRKGLPDDTAFEGEKFLFAELAQDPVAARLHLG